MPRLPLDPGEHSRESWMKRFSRRLRFTAKKTFSHIMTSHPVKMPKSFPDLPLRLRPWFLAFTFVIMIFLALLGFTNVANGWSINDKILHFICLGFATGVFYFIFDVEEDARRIWFWRYFGLIAAVLICFFFGGIVSEFVQSTLPYKTFQFGDVVANLLGSSLGLFISFNLERYYRRRREIARLYQPLYDDSGLISEAEDEEMGGSAPSRDINPSHQPQALPKGAPASHTQPGTQPLRFQNVWDDRMDLFDIGDDDAV